MPINHTNRKGQTYTLYKGQTKTGKPRYYFGRTGQSQDEEVAELPPGFTISESVNGIVSLVKDRPSLILPEEVAAIETEMKRHPQAHRYRVAAKHNMIEIYEQSGPDIDELLSILPPSFQPKEAVTSELQADLDRTAQFTPVLRFTLLKSAQRQFGVERMCYRSSIDGWLELYDTKGMLAKMAHKLIPTLGTDDFFELW